jgi:RNA polymerase sigma factor (sigma-70 family)
MAPSNDIDSLYRSLAPKLEQIVRTDVRAPRTVIEDACQFAWSSLVFHAERVRPDAALSWLARTAVHEALKLTRRDARHLSLEATLESSDEHLLGRSQSMPHKLLEEHERLAALRALPERQQRLMWLHALGLNYDEMALYTGSTRRTIERQLLRAKRRIREQSVVLGEG